MLVYTSVEVWVIGTTVVEDSLVIVDNVTGHVVVVITTNEVVVAGGGVSVLTLVVSSVLVIGYVDTLVYIIVDV
jgi:hypothetical protein